MKKKKKSCQDSVFHNLNCPGVVPGVIPGTHMSKAVLLTPPASPPASPDDIGSREYAGPVQAVPTMKAMNVLESDNVSNQCALP
jgi:hypothetical protein